MERIATQLVEAVKFIQPYIPLIDSHMVSFLTLNLWETYVPLNIRIELNEDNEERVIDIFSNAASSGKSKLKELNTFIQCATRLDIAQQESVDVKKIKQILDINHYDLKQPLLEGFMKIKKSHEVDVLVELVASLANRYGVSHVVEIGDGKGYTSTILALQHGIKVLGLESSQDVILGAEKRKSKLNKHWGSSCETKHASSKELPLHRQAQVHVTESTDIGYWIRENFPEDSHDCILGVTGLHTCGDLSPICLKLFVSSKQNESLQRFLINVGCCYHLLNCSSDHMESNFPMSNLLKEKGFSLSRNARMLSLQAPSKMFHLKKDPPESLLYRAVFEQLLDETIDPGILSSRDVGRIGSKCQNFVQYVRKASTVLGQDIPIKDELLELYYKRFDKQLKKLQYYFMLRVILAPVIEGIILLDRLMFLREQGIDKSYLVKLFDPTISPRCYGIIAVRDN